jgi:hypothetical protein
MHFHDRNNERARLDKIHGLSHKTRQLLYVTGRRRIGKTDLLNNFIDGKRSFYLFVGKQTEAEFLSDLSSALVWEEGFSRHTRFTTLAEAAEFILGELLEKREIVVLDEFQNFKYVNPAFFSHFQKQWDRTKSGRGMVIVCGSMQSMMHEIFESEKEPLYKRATARLVVEEFTPSALAGLLRKEAKRFSSRNLFDLYSVFGGVPFYYYLLDANGLFDAPLREVVSSLIMDKNAVLYDEGRDLTIEALGKSHAVYHTILSAVASGRTKHGEIVDAVGEDYGILDKYLRALVIDYRFLARSGPLGRSFPNAKSTRYRVRDNFLAFWFRYVHRFRSMLEAGRAADAVSACLEDLPVHQGRLWEKLAHEILVELNSAGTFEFGFQEAGPYFHQNHGGEIDLVLMGPNKTFAACECKLNLNTCNIPSVMHRLSEAVESSRLGTPAKMYLLSVADINERTAKLVRGLGGVEALSLTDLVERT